MWGVLFIIVLTLQVLLISLMVFLAVVNKHQMFKIKTFMTSQPQVFQVNMTEANKWLHNSFAKHGFNFVREKIKEENLEFVDVALASASLLSTSNEFHSTHPRVYKEYGWPASLFLEADEWKDVYHEMKVSTISPLTGEVIEQLWYALPPTIKIVEDKK